jgi:DNA polymerase-3 subunit epsilon
MKLWPFGRAAGPGDRRSDGTRWVVIDVETTGLDPARDRLLAIAGVAVHRRGERLAIALGDSFELVVRRADADTAPVDKDNILLHGIGIGAQRAGAEPAQALQRFTDWAADAPRLGFHVAFDRAVIERAERAALGRASPALWVDIEPLAALTQPQVRARALDEWMAHFGITCLQRHQAAADTLATAELLLRLWPRLRAEGATDGPGLAKLAAARRWVG